MNYRNFASLKKILIILTGICAIACTNKMTTIYNLRACRDPGTAGVGTDGGQFLFLGRLFGRLLKYFLIFSVFPAFSQDRLVPVGRSSSYEYYERVDDLLLGRGRNKYVFQVRPSFEPETCLFFSDETKELVLREAGKNIWYSEEWYSPSKASKKRRDPNSDMAIKEYRCPVSTRISEKLDSLFMSAVFSSSLMNDSSGLDGTTFELRTFWGRYAASCWSPRQDDSNCSRLVRVLEALCGFVKEGTINGIEGLIPEIDALTAIFTDLLPQGGKIVNRETGFLYESR